MQIAYPFHKNPLGLIAAASEEDHIRQMIEQVLFTEPGERVNRPDFGCGLSLFLFQSPTHEVLVALQAMLQASLQRWVGDLIRTQAVTVTMNDSELSVSVQYALLSSGTRATVQFFRTRTLAL